MLEATQVPLVLFQNTAKFYMSNPEYQPEIEKLAESLESQYKKNTDVPYRKLEKEEAIEVIRELEEQKISAIRNVQNGVRARQINPQQVPMVLEMQKELCYDKVAVEKGIEALHIENAIKDLNLTEDDDFKAMMDAIKAKNPDLLGAPAPQPAKPKETATPPPVQKEEEEEDLGW